MKKIIYCVEVRLYYEVKLTIDETLEHIIVFINDLIICY